jgi:hypothetical protein
MSSARTDFKRYFVDRKNELDLTPENLSPRAEERAQKARVDDQVPRSGQFGPASESRNGGSQISFTRVTRSTNLPWQLPSTNKLPLPSRRCSVAAPRLLSLGGLFFSLERSQSIKRYQYAQDASD